MADKEEWRLCVDWLVRCNIIQSDHRVTSGAAQVFDLAQVLRDGVLICHLLNALHAGAIDLKDFSQRPQMSQFLCLKNIRAFLNTCRKTFGLDGDLFDPYDLFEVRDFGKVIKTLSLLSKSPKAKASGIAGFPPSNFVRRNSDYYNTLEELATDIPDEDIYGPIQQEDDNDIYEDLCSLKRPSSQTPEVVRSKRDYCMKELEETEKNYVDALDMIILHFVRPLKTCTSPDDHKVIFLSLEALYTIHRSFLAELQKATGSTPCKASHKPTISECFIQWKEKFLIYGDFCSNLPKAQERVDELCQRSEAVRERINECQKRANDGKFRLRDLLSVPMQRVLKYHLLLTELIKHTDVNHPERQELLRALEEMKDLSLYVNEVKRDNEALNLIQEIQSSIADLQMPENTSLKDYGKLLKDGELKIKSHQDNKAKTRYIFLFDKVMLMCKSRGETYGYKSALVLSQYRVEDARNNRSVTTDKPWSYTFLLVEKNGQSAYTIQAKTEDTKKKKVPTATLR